MKITVIISLLFFFTFNSSSNLETFENEQENEDFYKVVHTNSGDYMLEIFNQEGNVLYARSFPVEPGITKISANRFKIVVSIGSPANYTHFYDIAADRESITYFNLLFSNEDTVVYFKDAKLIVADIFDEDLFYKEIIRDFSKLANPSYAITSVTIIDSIILQITYFEGDNLQKKQKPLTYLR